MIASVSSFINRFSATQHQLTNGFHPLQFVRFIVALTFIFRFQKLLEQVDSRNSGLVQMFAH
jgi:hypothetical protein